MLDKVFVTVGNLRAVIMGVDDALLLQAIETHHLPNYSVCLWIKYQVFNIKLANVYYYKASVYQFVTK